MAILRYSSFSLSSKPLVGAAVLAGVLAIFGLGAAWYIEHHGHVVTGMDNQVVWGIPHVFAVFLILSASGALNVASMSSVFGRNLYEPLARLSGLVAIALLLGGLVVLVLDLGRPDQLVVAMTTYNFKSIFAWNIFFYTGMLVITAVYLWTMMEYRMNRFTKAVGILAFLWRLALTTGTGLIFGFLVARQGYDAALLGPLFIAMSFSFGLAVMILTVMGLYGGDGRSVGDFIIIRLGRLLGIFVAAVFYFVLVHHLTNLYTPQLHPFELFILVDGGVVTMLFWIGQIAIGTLVPLALLFGPAVGLFPGNARYMTVLASMLVILGGLAQLFVIIIGGQSFPLDIFPGWHEHSFFFDGERTAYQTSLPEVILGIGGVALATLIVLLGTKVLAFMPLTLEGVEPNHEQ